MAPLRVSIATPAIVAAILVAACIARTAGTDDPTGASLPTDIPLATPSPSVGLSALVSPTPVVSSRACDVAPFFFTPPPYDRLDPVPGISVRAVDKTHFEITNATSRTYYLGFSYWVTEDNLVCGRGVIAHSNNGGRLRPGATIEIGGGSTPEMPMTVSIWANPCGEGCYRAPIGEYVVPVSSVEPPEPGPT